MNSEVKEKWLEALRSGEYEQGKAYLNRDGKFCCLGVLCEVAIQQGVEVDRVPSGGGTIAYGLREERSSLPPEIQNWSGVDGSMGPLPVEVNGESCLAFLNDVGTSFTEIADVIEKHL